ncbi:hypothetical protein ATK74_0009 [Propionicimonas paludicola]|uniref:Uncharacterized protein n=1 Tax=Propionicimonas paludicola TaxID=185243 RepID=A0A2A9CMT7_9ACTN|nr:hypothetical protein ATK74_0009 [Propionicimonas paludicola]
MIWLPPVALRLEREAVVAHTFLGLGIELPLQPALRVAALSMQLPRSSVPAPSLRCGSPECAFWQGSYVRAGVDLQRHYYPDPLLITDLDLLAYSFTPQMKSVKLIGEAKSGTGKSAPKPLDRVIWLAGLQRIVRADHAILLTATPPSERVRDLARTLDVAALSTGDLGRWEQRDLAEMQQNAGSQGPEAWQATASTHFAVKKEPVLERAFWSLRSEIWFVSPWQATKRCVGIIAELRKWWTPTLDDDDQAALRWLYAEAISVLGLQIVMLVGLARSTDPRDWRQQVEDRLAEGLVPAHAMRTLSKAVDMYVARALSAAGADATLKAESVGAFEPAPPPWTEQLVELINRLAEESTLSELPRHIDLVIHERLVKRRHIAPDLLQICGHDLASGERHRRWLAAFLRSAAEIPDAVSKALTA